MMYYVYYDFIMVHRILLSIELDVGPQKRDYILIQLMIILIQLVIFFSYISMVYH